MLRVYIYIYIYIIHTHTHSPIRVSLRPYNYQAALSQSLPCQCCVKWLFILNPDVTHIHIDQHCRKVIGAYRKNWIIWTASWCTNLWFIKYLFVVTFRYGPSTQTAEISKWNFHNPGFWVLLPQPTLQPISLYTSHSYGNTTKSQYHYTLTPWTLRVLNRQHDICCQQRMRLQFRLRHSYPALDYIWHGTWNINPKL